MNDDFSEKPENSQRFTIVPFAKYLERPSPEFWVDGWIPKDGLVFVPGGVGDGKTFWLIDLAGAIQAGRTWNGCDVERTNVLYIACEGNIVNRLKAYDSQFPNSRFDLIDDVPDFTDLKNISLLAARVEYQRKDNGKWPKYGVIIVDTFTNAVAGASLNDMVAMGNALKLVRELRKRTESTVIFAAHLGKNELRGMMGWQGLKAAADAEITLTRDNDIRYAEVTKQKETPDGAVIGFKLRGVAIGKNRKGKTITSCVVERIEDDKLPKERGARRALTGTSKTALDVLTKLLAKPGAEISVEDWVAETVRKMTFNPDAKRDTREQRVRQCIDRTLVPNKHVFLMDDMVTLTESRTDKSPWD